MLKFVTMFAFLVPFMVSAHEGPREVRIMADKFNATMMVCPEKIWPSYNWDGLTVVMLYPKQEFSWLWDASSNSISRIDNNSLPSSASGSFYAFFDLNGRKSMSLNMEEGIKEVFQLGIHEFFHHHGQSNWTRAENSGGRGTEYPVSWQPRLYRRMIFENLKRYLESNNSLDLRKAKFWFDRWTNEYPNESRATTDGYEGTAEYVETMAEVVAKFGCAAPDETLKSSVIAQIKSDFGFSVGGQHFGLDSEGYEIGGLSALILRFKESHLASWTSRISKGETPLKVLLESVKSVDDFASQELIKMFQNSAQRINAERAPLLDQDIANWSNKSFVRVAAPYKWLQSNLFPKFFAQSSHLNIGLYPLSTTHHYLSPDRRSDFKLKTNAILFSHYSQACPSQYLYTLVPNSQIQMKNGQAIIRSPMFEGNVVGRVTNDDQGFQYLCVD